MLSKPLLKELRQIMERKYNLKLNDKELLVFANSLVGYFDLLLKGSIRK